MNNEHGRVRVLPLRDGSEARYSEVLLRWAAAHKVELVRKGYLARQPLPIPPDQIQERPLMQRQLARLLLGAADRRLHGTLLIDMRHIVRHNVVHDFSTASPSDAALIAASDCAR